MKFINGFLGLLFLVIAAVQINDPDPVLWVLVYLFTAMICLQGILGRLKIYYLIVGVITFVALASTKVAGVIDWMSAGEQSEIFGEMTGERPYVEDTREFFGLIMALGAIAYNWTVLRKQKKIRNASS